jgi:hypothetical protein
VKWSATGGTIDQDGLFTAPWVGGEYTITATSTDDSRSKHAVNVTVSRLAIALSPETASLKGGTTQQFAATVTAGRLVKWSATGGSITQTGLFTAPTGGGTFTITATSVDDPNVSASATVTATEAPLLVSLVAGSTTAQSGTTNATGSSARFNNPSGIARLSATALLVADETNNCIRHVTTAGVVTTFAGSCSSTKGTADGHATNTARFSAPHGITITSDGTVWVGEATNTPKLRRIRLVSGVWTVDTPTLQYNSSLVKLDYFYEVTHAADDSLLIINRNRSNVVKATPVDATTLAVSIVAGPDETVTTNRNSATNGTCSNARFSANLRGVAVLDSKIYVSDYSYHCIRMIDPAAAGGCLVTTVVGVCDSTPGALGGRQDASPATSAKLYNPFGLAAGPDGQLYIAEYSNNIISTYNPSQDSLLRFAGTGGATGYADGDPLTEAKFYNPGSITVGDDGAYLTERWGNRVRRIGR